MMLTIWIAASLQRFYPSPNHEPLFWWALVWTMLGLFPVILLAIIVRRRRRATLADLGEGPLLWSLFLARFMFPPTTFILLILSILASAIRLGFANTLWLATVYVLLYGLLVSLLTTFAAHLAAAIKGPRPGSASGS